MKKQLSKITLKADKIVSLTKAQAHNVAGGVRNETKIKGMSIHCPNCTTTSACPC